MIGRDEVTFFQVRGQSQCILELLHLPLSLLIAVLLVFQTRRTDLKKIKTPSPIGRASVIQAKTYLLAVDSRSADCNRSNFSTS
jgi:hypothetical protein